MAAATQSRQKSLRDWPHLIKEVRLSSITAGQAEDIIHYGPAGKNPDWIEFEMVTPPDAPCAFSLYHDTANDAPGAVGTGTARVKLVAEGGGDLTGLVLNLRLGFYCSASGGIDASNATA